MSEYRGRRITADEVEEAYRETGMKPARYYLYAGPTTGCCGIGVMVLDEIGREGCDPGEFPWSDAQAISQKLGLKGGYRAAFIAGFDGGPRPTRVLPSIEVGFSDGLAAAARVFSEPPR